MSVLVVPDQRAYPLYLHQTSIPAIIAIGSVELFNITHAQDQHAYLKPGLEVIKLEFILRLKIKHNDWLLVDTCPQAANHCALF